MVAGTTAYMWLPSIAALFLYKGSVTAPEAADPAALALSQKLIAARTSFSNLLRLDGLIWWPKTRNAALYDSVTMMLLTSVPAFVAFLALRTRARVVAWFWLAAAIGLFLAKGVHPPLPISLLWLQDRIRALRRVSRDLRQVRAGAADRVAAAVRGRLRVAGRLAGAPCSAGHS